MLKDNYVLKIQGISEQGFWMRLYKTKPYKKFMSEIWVSSKRIEHIIEFYSDDKDFIARFIEIQIQTMKNKIAKGESSFTQGELYIYKTINQKPQGFPVVDIPVSVDYTDGTEIDDAVVRHLHDVQNKCNAIDALFESIDNDLEFVFENHFDNNSAIAANEVRRKFKKLAENFYETVVEPLGEEWTFESLLGMLYRLEKDNHQVMVVPEIRRYFQEDILRTDKLTPEEETELENFIKDIRDQFGLPDNWR